MDELFREAADNYQLPTEKAFDWEKVSSALSEEKNKGPMRQPLQKKKKFVLWYLLFIPLGWFAHYAYNYQTKSILNEHDANSRTAKEKIMQAPASPFLPGNKKENVVTPVAVAAPKESIQNNDNASLIITAKPFKHKAGIITAFPSAISGSSVPVLEMASVVNNKKGSSKNISVNELIPGTTQKIDATIKDVIAGPVNDTALTAKKATTKSRRNRFYASLLLAPDISFIKFQKASRIGSSFGIMGGYAINKKWSIETGIISSKKNYYTAGKYFDKTTIAGVGDKTLVSVDGKCRMIEIPLIIRYTSDGANRNAFTAAAGASSYFMNEEYYTYSFVADGRPVQYDEEYDNGEKKIFTVINFAAGYRRSIGKTVSVRAEPYIKMPVQKIGTGNLSLSSTGINLAITKSFY